MEDKTINDHINDDINELDNPFTNSQRRRHLEQELEELNKYKESHPNSNKNPTSLELYCYNNPHAPECRIYEV
jgi:hypothetical protein